MLANILEEPEIRKMAFSFSVSQYHHLISDEATELIKGLVIKKMPKSPLHTTFLALLSNFLKFILPESYCLRQESPISTPDSEPEPDISIVEGSYDQYFSEHPKTAIIVIEIAVTSLELDRAKALVYAEANVPVYWIIRPEAKLVEIYSDPKDGIYLSKTEKPFTDNLNLFNKHFSLTDFLPKI